MTFPWDAPEWYNYAEPRLQVLQERSSRYSTFNYEKKRLSQIREPHRDFYLGRNVHVCFAKTASRLSGCFNMKANPFRQVIIFVIFIKTDSLIKIKYLLKQKTVCSKLLGTKYESSKNCISIDDENVLELEVPGE